MRPAVVSASPKPRNASCVRERSQAHPPRRKPGDEHSRSASQPIGEAKRVKESYPFPFRKGEASCTFSLKKGEAGCTFPTRKGEAEWTFSPRKGEAGCTLSGSGLHLFRPPSPPFSPKPPNPPLSPQNRRPSASAPGGAAGR